MVFVHVLCGLLPQAGPSPSRALQYLQLIPSHLEVDSLSPLRSCMLLYHLNSQTHTNAHIQRHQQWVILLLQSWHNRWCNNMTFPIFLKIAFFSPSHRFILTDKHGLRTQRPVCGALITGLNQCDLQGKRRVKSKLYATSWIGFRDLKQGSNSLQTVLIQAIHFIFCFVRVKTAKQPAYFASESSGAMQVWCGVKGKNLTRNMLYLYIKCKVYPLC